MENITNLIIEFLIFGIIIILLTLYLAWLFLKSAIARGVEDGVYNALMHYDEEKEHPSPTPQQQIDEELENW